MTKRVIRIVADVLSLLILLGTVVCTVNLGTRRVPLSPGGRLWLCASQLSLMLLFAVLTVCSALAIPLPIWLLPVAVVLVLAPTLGLTVTCIRQM